MEAGQAETVVVSVCVFCFYRRRSATSAAAPAAVGLHGCVACAPRGAPCWL